MSLGLYECNFNRARQLLCVHALVCGGIVTALSFLSSYVPSPALAILNI